MKILITSCGLLLPVVLFLFKYVLSAQFEKVYTKQTKERTKIKVEMMSFPDELLMIAMGYTLPKMIDVVLNLLKQTEISEEMLIHLLITIIFNLFVLAALPFMVVNTKIATKLYFSNEKQKAKKRCLFTYLVSVVTLIVSLILGV